jgi:hypothetical protein
VLDTLGAVALSLFLAMWLMALLAAPNRPRPLRDG